MQSLEQTTYHQILRIALVVSAVVLVFDSGLLVPETKALSVGTQHYLASVIGVEATVRPNELNLYTAALTQKEQELAAREAAIADREIAVSLNTASRSASPTSTYVLSTILFILLVLVILNYILDYLRSRNQGVGELAYEPTT